MSGYLAGVGAGGGGLEVRGWTPILAVKDISPGTAVLQVTAWVGGLGLMPATDVYLGPYGFVEDVNEAVNIRGEAGAGAAWGDIVGDLSQQADLWAILQGLVEEAPADGEQYVRSDGGWVQVDFSALEQALEGKADAQDLEDHINSEEAHTANHITFESGAGIPEAEDTVAKALDFLQTNRARYFGLITVPELTYDADTVTVTSCLAYLCTCEQFDVQSRGRVIEAPGTTLSGIVDNTVYYLTIRRPDGSSVGQFELTTSKQVVAQPNAALVAVVIKTGTVYHTALLDPTGIGLPERAEQLRKLRDGFNIITGLGLAATDRTVTLGAGLISYGSSKITVDELNSVTDNIRFYTHTGSGNFSFELRTLADNTNYNGPSGLVEMANTNRFNVNWFFRGAESQKHLYSRLSNAEYSSIAEAQAAPVPLFPELVTAHAVFVGGIIYRKGSGEPQGFILPGTTGGAVTGGTAVLHNNLGGIQGGDAANRYHSDQPVNIADSPSFQQLTLAQEGGGLTLRSANGTVYKLTVANDGSLVTTEVT